MAEAIKMPGLGQTVDEGTIEEWHISEGDPVELGDMLLTVETDKASVEVESAAEGVLLKQLVQPGETVEVGTIIAYVGEEGEEIDA
jgi:pyruvate/2-oxoglutarate dehydrogenase complex dihydrolipoamide acyltransferase (E2) component